MVASLMAACQASGLLASVSGADGGAFFSSRPVMRAFFFGYGKRNMFIERGPLSCLLVTWGPSIGYGGSIGSFYLIWCQLGYNGG